MAKCQQLRPVLIETYWNVNGKICERTSKGAGVLIETYWNVNKINSIYYFEPGGVLIETYWNVNLSSEGRKYIRSSINRNILECK